MQNNVVVKEAKPEFKTALVKQTETYTSMMINNFNNINLKLDEYQKVCLSNSIAKINELLYNNDLTFNSDKINQSNLTSVLAQISMLRLNPTATPRECYFQLRNDKTTKERESSGCKIIEFGVEGNGNDAILRTYGVGVANVLTPIIIREGDEFTYPYYDGKQMQPFIWKPKSFYRKPIAVVYIIQKVDGSVEYLVSERETVASNLKAHINQNLFTCYDNEIKKKILSKIQNMTLDEILADSELTNPIQVGTDSYGKPKYINVISPAWKSPQSREAMIVRKMRNNCIKNYPKDYSKAYAGAEYVEKAISDSIDYIDAEITTPQEKAIETVETTQQLNEGKVKPNIKQQKQEPQPQPQQQQTEPVEEELDFNI